MTDVITDIVVLAARELLWMVGGEGHSAAMWYYGHGERTTLANAEGILENPRSKHTHRPDGSE